MLEFIKNIGRFARLEYKIRKYGIDRIPQILLFQNGEEKSGFIGVQPEDIIKRWLEENLQ